MHLNLSLSTKKMSQHITKCQDRTHLNENVAPVAAAKEDLRSSCLVWTLRHVFVVI